MYFQGLSRSTAVEIVNSSKVLQAETKMLLDGKLLVQLYNFFRVFSVVFFVFLVYSLSLSTICFSVSTEAIQPCRPHISVSVFYRLCSGFVCYSFIYSVRKFTFSGGSPLCRRANLPPVLLLSAVMCFSFFYLPHFEMFISCR